MISLKVVQQTVRAALVTLVTLVSLDLVTASAAEKLVAPAYPGSVRLTPLQTKGRDKIVFVTKDSHEKVQAFYVPKYARLPGADEKGLQTDAKTNITFVVHSYAETLKIIQKAKGDYISWVGPTTVYLEWMPDEPSRKPAPNYFYRLEQESKKHPGHDAELAELRKKYAWLSRAFFLDKKDDTIYQRCTHESAGISAAMSDPKAQQELNAKIQKLTAEGRYQEASDLAKQAMGDPGKKQKADNFGLWKKCLEEAAGFAYLTKIVIQQDPSLWTY